MSPIGKFPLEGVYAYHRKKDNSLHISSDNEKFSDLDIIMDKKAAGSSELRDAMVEAGVINTSLGSLLKGFTMTGINHASYESGLTLIRVQKNDTISPLKIPEQYIPLSKYPVPGGGVIHVGIDCSSFGIIGIGGEAGSGRSTFLKKQLDPEATKYLDFATINYGTMNPRQKESYGNTVSQEFLRDSFKKFLVIDNYSTSRGVKNLNYHPTLYFDTFKQIVEHANFFRKAGKTLIICGVDDTGSMEKAKSDAYIEMFGNNLYMNYGFSFGNIDFPKIPVD
jgi:hypothetical protein